MKRLFTLLLAATSLSIIAHAQNPDRPRYQIHVQRADSSLGTIVVELFRDIAPLTVRNFDSLVSIGFYDGTAFHRVIPGFMIQGGDPNSRDQPEDTWGYGDPNQTTVPAEFSTTTHARGILSMARRGDDINSGTSQFFICVKNQPQLDGQYSVFGKVIAGMDVADTIVKAPRNSSDRPLVKIEMEIVRDLNADAPADADRTLSGAMVLPNPCGDLPRIEYALPAAGHVRLTIHDLTGRLIATPVDGEQSPGAHAAICDLTGNPPGFYTYTLAIGSHLTTGKFVKGE